MTSLCISLKKLMTSLCISFSPLLVLTELRFLLLYMALALEQLYILICFLYVQIDREILGYSVSS
ncbi:hypothetical protein Syun_027512 [Stephania yunnanensis]|uniref:Uncharacterized protein n=1 Tax=Stephania yunnanensis TaxID=152371 RepID=A0AAP0EFQ1_9MAGN